MINLKPVENPEIDLYVSEVDRDDPGTGETPNIYYIILDAYTSESNLKEFYDFDNSGFTKFLEDQGFFVVPDSYCNYPTTNYSLASSLNMLYMSSFFKSEDTEEKLSGHVAETIIRNKVEDNDVVQLLRSLGYKYIFFGSDWEITEKNKYADLNVNLDRFSEFKRVFIGTTILRLARDYLISYLSSYYERKRVNMTFAEIPKMKDKIKDPVFVFAHITLTHYPYLFGPNGEAITPVEEPPEESDIWPKDAYLDQISFANKKLEEMIQKIVSEEKIPPIIILQADHGPGSKGLSFEDETRIRMGILNAYLLPGGGSRYLYDSISPVNSFRVIFELYFGYQLEPLEDTYYVTVERENPDKRSKKKTYVLEDVTEILLDR